jgi:predicted nicotinamide N-methyase
VAGSPVSGPAGPDAVRDGTRLVPVPLVPEIRLYQTDDLVSLWQRTELAGQAEQDPPFWASAWAGGRALARYLLDHPATVYGKPVTDLASGSGLVAIAAALAGAGTVTAYDIDPLSVAAIGLNAAANNVLVRAVCADILDRDGPPGPGPAVVLVADAFYERELSARVMGFLERCAAVGATVLAGDLGRKHLPQDRLVPVARYEVPDLRGLEDRDTKTVTVWTLPGSAALPGSGTMAG